ncbi:MAG: agmatine deiminase family protein [bacterium]|nr:agmatine deiminase family protein [bacterium]
MICSRFALKLILLSILLVGLCILPATAQNAAQRPSNQWNVEQGIDLPIGKTQWEIDNEHLFPYHYPPTDDPPPQPAINPAEWEPMTGVLIRYPLGIPVSLVAEMSQEVQVLTIVSGASQQSQASSQYQSGGVNMTNCAWLTAPSNSMWTRDYGPWYIFNGDDVQGITDHIYNRPTRPDDNNIPWVIGSTYGIPVYGMPVVATGGNYMSTGMGVGMSTTLIYDENTNYSHAQVDQYMHDYCGLDSYVVVPDVLTSGIHHIDCWAKLIDPGRIVVKRLTPANAQLEANVAYFQSLISPYGKPYEIIRVDCYASTPYTNALILDNKVFVPLFGGALDAAAMQTWQDAMPGYEITGYTGSWVSDDAIHCRAMGITDAQMLRIVHVPLADREGTGQPIPVQANIHAYSNRPLSTGMPVIYWRVGSGAYSTTPMTSQGDDNYLGNIPNQPNNSTISYYIHAEDLSGRSENHPYIGSGNPHIFRIITDTTPPLIVHQPLGDLSIYAWPPTIEADITDNTGIDQAYVEYTINGVPQTNVELTAVGNHYSGQLVGTVVQGNTYQYRIVAIDASQNANTAYAPPTGMYGGQIVGGFFSDMENGAPGWTHSIVNPGFIDQWHISTQQNHTPGGSHSWKCGDTGTGNYASLLDAGLVSPEYNIQSGANLSFWHQISAEISSTYPGYAYDGGIVEISVNGGAYSQITPAGGYPYLIRLGSNPGPFPAETPVFSGSVSSWQQVSFTLGATSGNVKFRFRFGSDGGTNLQGWYIDDVMLTTGAGAPALDLTISPVNPPIQIPANGGSFQFNINIHNTTTSSIAFSLWNKLRDGSGNYYPVLGPINRSLPGGANPTRILTQSVAASIPSGTLTYVSYVGTYPSTVIDSSFFTIIKLTTSDGGPWVSQSDCFGDLFDEFSGAMTAPTAFALNGAYPNPFNPTTTISYELPATSLVNLTVYDVNGRKVAELINGLRDAGAHAVTFDGSGLASGVYIYRLTAGDNVADGKIVLMK